MKKPQYMVVNEKSEFYCDADGEPWSDNEAKAERFLVLSEAQAIAAAKNGFVVPKHDVVLSDW